VKHTLAILAVLIGSAALSNASPVMLTVTQVIGKQYQQNEQNPCIFESMNCHNPASFPAQAVPGMGNITDWDLFSLTYSGSQLDAFLGTPGSLGIGLDLNNNANPQSLVIFEMYIGDPTNAANLVACLTLDCSATNMVLSSPNNGQGWADFLITGFPTYSPNDQITFRWAFGTTLGGTDAANDGPDNAFVIGATSYVPEPTTWLLMGSGLLAIGLLRRRQHR